ncbi:hypothetical protein Smp_114020 [Schistosoma mansoni]|nr:hypothetical protein Smp_114020 [Schistosoma mansoni]|eukprot:XP_018647342.1 hypothetical protein Smp_114020 [Schistosoma mansoni]
MFEIYFQFASIPSCTLGEYVKTSIYCMANKIRCIEKRMHIEVT